MKITDRAITQDELQMIYDDFTKIELRDGIPQTPVERYQLNRACLVNHSLEQLKAYVDYVEAHDSWLVFYDHDLGVNGNITADTLGALLKYCKQKGVEIVTSSEALAKEADF